MRVRRCALSWCVSVRRASASTSSLKKTQIAIVGSGPSGCFVAQHLTKQRSDVHVDIYESLPVPFGLSRYGVAPDHPEVKNVERQFLDMFRSGRVTWIGNISVGTALPVPRLLEHYAAVVIATGAGSSRRLSVPGSDLGNIIPARAFVDYYNTYPFPHGSPRFCPFDLRTARNVVIVGNGNVALDCARVLVSPYKRFAPTDMNCVAVRELMHSAVRRVSVVARRGPAHSAFTISEFRELTRCGAVRVEPFDAAAALRVPAENPRARRRLLELLARFAHPPPVPTESTERERTERTERAEGTEGGEGGERTERAQRAQGKAEGAEGGERTERAQRAQGAEKAEGTEGTERAQRAEGAGRAVDFLYRLRPVRFLPSPTRPRCVGAAVFERPRDGDGDGAEAAGKGKGKGEGSGDGAELVTVPCDAVITSVGYAAGGVAGVAFDEAAGTVPHTRGRVHGHARVYCAGWAKKGARGVIAHSLMDAKETVASIVEDLDQHVIPTGGAGEALSGKFGLMDYFVEKKLEPVSMAGLERIMHVEEERGVDLGKRLEKINSVRDMLDVALGGEQGKRANNAIRGITNDRPDALLYLKELLDDTTDLAPFARHLSKDMMPVMAERHPPGKLDPSQL